MEIGEYQRWGGMASYSVAPVRAVSAIPEPLDMAQAATLNGELPCSHNSHCSFCTSADSFLPDETMCEIQSLDSDFVCIGAYETAYHALVHCGRVQQGQLLKTFFRTKFRLEEGEISCF